MYIFNYLIEFQKSLYKKKDLCPWFYLNYQLTVKSHDRVKYSSYFLRYFFKNIKE